jgi:uncharacterized protein (UPF0147 family)
MENTVEILNSITQFNDISEYMQDEELTKVLVIVSKLIANPDVPPAKATLLITQLQAYSSKFAMLAAWYSHVKKDERAKKNIYYTAREAVDKLVDALKYNVRTF